MGKNAAPDLLAMKRSHARETSPSHDMSRVSWKQNARAENPFSHLRFQKPGARSKTCQQKNAKKFSFPNFFSAHTAFRKKT